MTVSKLLTLIAVVLFVLGGLGINPISHQELWGLAFFAASFLV